MPPSYSADHSCLRAPCSNENLTLEDFLAKYLQYRWQQHVDKFWRHTKNINTYYAEEWLTLAQELCLSFFFSTFHLNLNLSKCLETVTITNHAINNEPEGGGQNSLEGTRFIK